jgi:hypothetical protein
MITSGKPVNCRDVLLGVVTEQTLTLLLLSTLSLAFIFSPFSLAGDVAGDFVDEFFELEAPSTSIVSRLRSHNAECRDDGFWVVVELLARLLTSSVSTLAAADVLGCSPSTSSTSIVVCVFLLILPLVLLLRA